MIVPNWRWQPSGEMLRIDRWLSRRVGRPWAEVLREAQRMPMMKHNSFSRVALLNDVSGFVETNTILRDGRVMRVGPARRVVDLKGEFYVHPQTGLLCQSPKVRFRGA